jgi:acetyltransferase-like isoleucine patch superfamily enzyme
MIDPPRLVRESPPGDRYRPLRFVWAVTSVLVVESVVFGLSILPAALFWFWHFEWTLPHAWVRIVVLSMSFIPAYCIFAIMLMALSAGAMRLCGWRSPENATMPIRELGWPLLDWGRYLVSTHLVRIFAGTVFRATPLWSWYLRMNGARTGSGVWVNSLSVNDHNLLEMGDQVVIGESVHLSGHTVERGAVRTGRVRLGDNVTIGLESVVGIGVEIGSDAQVGALSLVPKGTVLEGGATYVGIPVRRIERASSGADAPES